MTEPVRIVPTKSDAEIANELRTELLAAFRPVCEIMERARAAGFICNVQFGAPGPHAPIAISQLQIMKSF